MSIHENHDAMMDMVRNSLNEGAFDDSGEFKDKLAGWLKDAKPGRIHVLADKDEAGHWLVNFLKNANLKTLIERTNSPAPLFDVRDDFFFIKDERGMSESGNEHLVIAADSVNGMECFGTRDERMNFIGTYDMPDWYDADDFLQNFEYELKRIFGTEIPGCVSVMMDSHAAHNWRIESWMESAMVDDKHGVWQALSASVINSLDALAFTCPTPFSEGYMLNGFMCIDKLACAMPCNDSIFMRASIAHEVAAHMGLENMLSKSRHETLTAVIKEWMEEPSSEIMNGVKENFINDGHHGYTDSQMEHEFMAWYFENAAMECEDFFEGDSEGSERALRKLDDGGKGLTPEDISHLAWMSVEWVKENSTEYGLPFNPESASYCLHKLSP